MKHKGTRIIETERLLLRPFENGDAPAAYRNWCSEEAVTRFLTWPPHADQSVTEALFADWAAGYTDPAFYQWAIVLKSIREPIGSISVVEQNERTNAVSIGYCIGQRWWRQGITTEAFRAVIRYHFEAVGAKRIEARHNVKNPNSGRVMRACGLTYEGTLRQAMVDNQGVVDVCVYSILRSEYEAQKLKREAGREA
jgi:ribosomal-protein-alanine N-acetyltransferase